MPISSRFVIGSSAILLAIGFLTLLGIVGSTAWLSEKSQSYFEESNRSRALRTSAVELRSALQNAESSQRGYLVGGNEIYLAPYDSAKAQAGSQLQHLKASLSAFPQTARLMERLSQLVVEKIEDMDRTIAMKRELRDAEALTTFGRNRGKALMDE